MRGDLKTKTTSIVMDCYGIARINPMQTKKVQALRRKIENLKNDVAFVFRVCD